MNPGMKQRRLLRRLLEGGAVLGGLAVVGLAVLLAALALEHRAAVTLPTPTGPFAVGRALYDWVDAVPDTLAPAPGTKRELLVWMWYPAAAGQSSMQSAYVPAAVQQPARSSGGSTVLDLLTRDLSRVHAHSIDDADVASRQGPHPVVLMRGGASAPVRSYSTLAEDLASHGYVVVGLDAPYRTGLVVFPDGRVIARTPENNPELASGKEFYRLANRLLAAWTADMTFVLDRLERLNTADPSGRFTGRLDMKRVGAFGHSFGGAQAAQWCHQDSRCKAGIDIDGAPLGSVVREGLDKPFMFLLSDRGDFSSDAETRRIKAELQSIYERLPVDGRLQIVIRGANHFTFSDDGALLKSRVMRTILRGLGKLGIDGRRQLAVTAYCVRTFFDAYLKGEGRAPLELTSPLYPEIRALH